MYARTRTQVNKRVWPTASRHVSCSRAHRRDGCTQQKSARVTKSEKYIYAACVSKVSYFCTEMWLFLYVTTVRDHNLCSLIHACSVCLALASPYMPIDHRRTNSGLGYRRFHTVTKKASTEHASVTCAAISECIWRMSQVRTNLCYPYGDRCAHEWLCEAIIIPVMKPG
jgi:hypothetical protein